MGKYKDSWNNSFEKRDGRQRGKIWKQTNKTRSSELFTRLRRSALSQFHWSHYTVLGVGLGVGVAIEQCEGVAARNSKLMVL